MTSDKYYMELESENKELKERLARECRGEDIQASIDWLYMNNQISDTALDILNKKRHENNELNKEIKEWRANFQEERQETKQLKKENKELKDLVDYDGFKLQILETEVNNAMDYIDEAIERYSSPNPMVHKSTMLADFAELKKLLMN